MIMCINLSDIEMQRRLSERNLRSYSAREKMQEAEEKERMVREGEAEKKWIEGDR